MCQPSDVVLLPFPFSDFSAQKKRPVLVLKAENMSSGTNNVTIGLRGRFSVGTKRF